MSQAIVIALLAALAAGASLLELSRAPARGHGRRALGGKEAQDGGGGMAAGETGEGADPVGPRRWAATARADVRTEALLDAAGRGAVPDGAALEARRRLGALLGGAWGGAVGVLLATPTIAVSVAACGLVGGRWLPLVLLRREGRDRAQRLQDESPELLDLLAAALGCGLPVQAAFDVAGRWSVGELSRGVRRAATELARGAAIAPTLARLAREHPAPELEAAVAILERSRRNGTPAAAPLRALAVTARHARARRAMEHAARAAPRVQLVAALLLVPAALCVLGASLMAGRMG